MILPSSEFFAADESELRNFARRFGEELQPGACVALVGDLGAGKTAFVRFLTECLNAGQASSPTFTLVNTYSGDCTLHHFDFYRIGRKEELLDLGFNEYFLDADSIKLIEWADMFPDLLPPHTITITITVQQDETRKITVSQS